MIPQRLNLQINVMRALAVVAGLLAPSVAFPQMYCSSIYGTSNFQPYASCAA
jgi:hypothetical protein